MYSTDGTPVSPDASGVCAFFQRQNPPNSTRSREDFGAFRLPSRLAQLATQTNGKDLGTKKERKGSSVHRLYRSLGIGLEP